ARTTSARSCLRPTRRPTQRSSPRSSRASASASGYARRVGDDLAFALELADLADSITLARFRAADLHVETKPDLTPVSEADRAVEGALRGRIARARRGGAGPGGG